MLMEDVVVGCALLLSTGVRGAAGGAAEGLETGEHGRGVWPTLWGPTVGGGHCANV